jgi:hypothetical protein
MDDFAITQELQVVIGLLLSPGCKTIDMAVIIGRMIKSIEREDSRPVRWAALRSNETCPLFEDHHMRPPLLKFTSD